MSILTVILQAVGFEDPGSNSNPTQSGISWKRSVTGLPVGRPTTQPLLVPPMGTLLVFSGERDTSIDGTTAFSIAGSPNDANRYRVTHTGGTAPAFRDTRSLACSGVALTVAVQPNFSVKVTAGSGTPFSSVQVGDTVFIPGESTGDVASPFSSLNEGYWTAIAATGASVTLLRAPGTIFQGISEVVTPSTNAQIQAFSSSDGVQVGDVVAISGGFAITSRHSYDILAVNPSWIEFESTLPLGSETGVIPTASGMIFYTAAKRWVRVEGDQEFVVRVNGDTSDKNTVEPIIPGNKDFTGWYDKFGATWALAVVNKSTSPLNIVVLSAE